MMPASPPERPLFAKYTNSDNETRRVRVSQLTLECASVAIQLAEEPDTSWESGDLVHGGINEQGKLVVHRNDSAARHTRLEEAHKTLKKKAEERNDSDVQAALNAIRGDIAALYTRLDRTDTALACLRDAMELQAINAAGHRGV